MANNILLSQLLKNLELRSILEALMVSWATSVTIEDLQGNFLLGQLLPSSVGQYRVTCKQQTIGWVKGDAPAKFLAQLLTYLAHQESLAFFDDLTGVPNRRFFERYLWQEWQRCRREVCSLSLLLADLDYFKAYNDHYGHPAGDRCLRQVAQALQAVLQRPADLVARYGGEEFVIVLPNTPSTGAEAVAQQLGQAIRQLQIPHRASTVSSSVTLSIGVTTLVPSAEGFFSTLLATADLALYQAKLAGRDRYCFFT